MKHQDLTETFAIEASITPEASAPGKSRRGFASMTPERRREVAAKGGSSVPSERRSFAQNHDLAVKAGRKGGLATDSADRSFSQDRELAARAGAKGGAASSGGGRRPKLD